MSNEAKPSSIGLNIREYRRGRGLTLRQLSLNCGVSVSYLSELERSTGENTSVSVLRRVAEGLGVLMVDLLDETHTHAWATCPQCGGVGALRVDLRTGRSTEPPSTLEAVGE